MTAFFVGVLDFLLLGTFLFWGILAAGVLILLALMNMDDDTPVNTMGIVLALLIGAVFYRNPEWYQYCLDNPISVVIGIGAYLVAGFPVSLAKWWNKIRRFKLEATIMKRKFIEELNNGRMQKDGRVGHCGKNDDFIEVATPLSADKPVPTEYQETFFKHLTDNRHGLERAVGVKLRKTEKGGYAPDSDKSPVKTWWFFWPFTIISVVYEPLSRFVIVWYERTRVIYRGMADKLGSTDNLVG